MWKEKDSSHSHEVDFIVISNNKIVPIEVKSSATKKHASIDSFCKKYSHEVGSKILFSQKDFSHDQSLELKPIYSVLYVLENI